MKFFRQYKKRPVQAVRNTVQIVFAICMLFMAMRFYQFYTHFTSTGITPYVEKPGGVEGFLPVSALVGLKVWLGTGVFDHIHPAGLILLLFIVGSGLLFKKSFCSWFCPIGTLGEWVANAGRKILGRNFTIPRWLTFILYPIKYIILFGFIYLILIEMPTMGAVAFWQMDYNKISDVKMMTFFLNIGGIGLLVIGVLLTLSFFFRGFWCRFLCPYGALIGLGSLLRLSGIKRNAESCIDCNKCSRVCPQNLQVSKAKVVNSPECTACLQCIEACPVKDTLQMSIVGKETNKWFVPVAFICSFILVITLAKLTGNWHTSITYEEFKVLLSNSTNIGH